MTPDIVIKGSCAKGEEDRKPYGIDVSSDVVIAACNEVIMINDDGEKNGSYKSEVLSSKQKRK